MAYRFPIVLAVVVGILLALPSLGGGFIPSDLPLIAQIEEWYPQMGQSFNVYASFLDLPTVPWWTSPHTKIAFWRPLSSAVLRLDHGLFGRHAVFYHLHSLVWLAEQLPLDPSLRGGQQLIILNGPGEYFLNYFPLAVDLDGPRLAEGWHVLSEAPHDFRLWRTGPRTLEIELLDGQFFASDWERFFRPPTEPLAAGDLVNTSLFQAEILAAHDRGPTRVAFHFDRDLGAPELVFLVWKENGSLRQVKLPAVGEALPVKWFPVPGDLLFSEPDEDNQDET